MKEIGADHEASPPLASLAVDHGHVLGVLLQPPVKRRQVRPVISCVWEDRDSELGFVTNNQDNDNN